MSAFRDVGRRHRRFDQRHLGGRELIQRPAFEFLIGNREAEVFETVDVDLVVDHLLQGGIVHIGRSPDLVELSLCLERERLILLCLRLIAHQLRILRVLRHLLVELEPSELPIVFAPDARAIDGRQHLARLDDVIPRGKSKQHREDRDGGKADTPSQLFLALGFLFGAGNPALSGIVLAGNVRTLLGAGARFLRLGTAVAHSIASSGSCLLARR